MIVVALRPEALLAFPNYIAFFNLAAGGTRGGLNLLGDSNLDWGQDLKLLAEWRQKHPTAGSTSSTSARRTRGRTASMITSTSPAATNSGRHTKCATSPGVLAVSATMLQGIYAEDDFRAIYSTLRKLQPFEVLGGTIYLYHWPPTDLPAEVP